MGTIFLAIAILAVTCLIKSPGVDCCDFFDGKWVYDNSYPLYDVKSCPFIYSVFDCQKNGRPDWEYLKYRWQPNNCNLRRWDGRDFLWKIRGKRIMFVGDSLSLNQWQSLTCLLHNAAPQAQYNIYRNGALSTFAIPSEGVTVMYLRNALLVDIVREKHGRVLKLDSVSGSSQAWLGNDILIFDTWHWWLHTGRKQPWDIIQDGNYRTKDMDRLTAYGKALWTWSRWVDSNIDTNRVKIFFQGVSPDHYDATEWGMKYPGQCGREQRPLNLPYYPGGPHKADVLLQDVLRKMSKPVHFLSISKLSQLRVDGHPSVYGNARHLGVDCTHWCLPGVPDTWNELFYATLD